MKVRSTVALSALCAAVLLGATMGVAMFGAAGVTSSSATDQTNPLLTEEQLTNLKAMADELREIGIDRDLASQLVEAQFEQYVEENLKSYNLTDDEVAGVMSQFTAINDKMSEIKEVAYEMRGNGSTVDEIFDVIDPMLDDLQNMQDQLVTTLDGYGISLAAPTGPGDAMSDSHRGPHEGLRGPPQGMQCDNSTAQLHA